MPRPAPGVPKPVLTPLQRRERAARRTLAALGYNECVTYSFIDEASAGLFGGGGAASRLDNPISSEMSHMRPDLLPGLLQAAARNQARGFLDLALFEVGPVFGGGEPEDQALQVAGLLVGAAAPRSPARRAAAGRCPRRPRRRRGGAGGAGRARAAPDPARPAGLVASRPLRATVAGAQDRRWRPSARSIRGRSRPMTCGGRPWPSSRGRSACPSGAARARPGRRSTSQACRRSSATSPSSSTAMSRRQTLVAAAQGADKALIEEVRVFDEFAGPQAEAQMGEGKKSLALTVRLQPREATLKEAEIEAVARKIVEKVTKATGGTLRG